MGSQAELRSLRRKLEQVQERNKRWAEEKYEWVQQRAHLCYRIDKLKGDLSRKHELNLKEELQNAKLGPIQDEMVKVLAAEKEKVAEKERELEKLKLDKQNHVLQQKHLQIRLKQLEEQLLQKDRELQELREKQEGWEKQRRETEENKNKWKRFFRRREASNENSPEKEQQTRYSPLFRLLLSWKSWKMSEQRICLHADRFHANPLHLQKNPE